MDVIINSVGISLRAHRAGFPIFSHHIRTLQASGRRLCVLKEAWVRCEDLSFLLFWSTWFCSTLLSEEAQEVGRLRDRYWTECYAIPADRNRWETHLRAQRDPVVSHMGSSHLQLQWKPSRPPPKETKCVLDISQKCHVFTGLSKSCLVIRRGSALSPGICFLTTPLLLHMHFIKLPTRYTFL